MNQKIEIEAAKSKYDKFGFVQTYQLNYNFPRRIQLVSNASAPKLSSDKIGHSKFPFK
jgi:hypothetical protein